MPCMRNTCLTLSISEESTSKVARTNIVRKAIATMVSVNAIYTDVPSFTADRYSDLLLDEIPHPLAPTLSSYGCANARARAFSMRTSRCHTGTRCASSAVSAALASMITAQRTCGQCDGTGRHPAEQSRRPGAFTHVLYGRCQRSCEHFSLIGDVG